MADENEKKDSSAVGKLNSAYKTYKNTKRIYNAIKAARAGTTAVQGVTAAASTAEVWIPVAIFFLFLVVVVIIFSGAAPGPVVGGNQSSPPPVSTSEIAKYIQFPYKINNADYSKGGTLPGEMLTDAQKNIIYNMFAPAFAYPKYKQLLTSKGPVYLYFFKPPSTSSGGVSGGGNYNNTDMVFYGFFESGESNLMKQHILIHESTHIIQRRNGLLGFNLSSLWLQDGSACYDAGWLKTYAYRSSGVCAYPGKGTQADEAQAEAVANSLLCTPGQSCDFTKAACSRAINFQSACSATNNWVLQNILTQ
jgi:hypothetical protein